MAPTLDVKEIFRDRARIDPEFADALLEQSVECLHTGEVNVARIILRDYIHATMGLDQLSRLTGKSPDNLTHLLKTDSNPEALDLLEVASLIQQHKHAQLTADNPTHNRGAAIPETLPF